MKFLEQIFAKNRKHFEPGGKFERLAPLNEANETFLLTPAEVTHGAPHIRDHYDLKRAMIVVVLALLPCTIFGIFNAGYQHNLVNMVQGATWITHLIQGLKLCLPIIFVSYAVGGFWEVLFSCVRRHPVSEGFLVTGLLFPLTLPPTIPLWQVAVGVSFGVVIGKEIFGGTGFNIVNPALVSRAFLYFAYPAQISGDNVWTSVVDRNHVVEGFTGATPLAIGMVPHGNLSVVEALNQAGFTIKNLFVGLHAGSIGETSILCCLIGAAVLIFTGVGSWRIMLGSVIGLTLGSVLVQHAHGGAATLKPLAELPFYYQMLIGSFAFGVIFMATDPVSATVTTAGKWIYGFLIGLMIILIRVANPAYPESTMLAIIFMNVMAPLIDHMVLQSHIKRRLKHVQA